MTNLWRIALAWFTCVAALAFAIIAVRILPLWGAVGATFLAWFIAGWMLSWVWLDSYYRKK